MTTPSRCDHAWSSSDLWSQILSWSNSDHPVTHVLLHFPFPRQRFLTFRFTSLLKLFFYSNVHCLVFKSCISTQKVRVYIYNEHIVLYFPRRKKNWVLFSFDRLFNVFLVRSSSKQILVFHYFYVYSLSVLLSVGTKLYVIFHNNLTYLFKWRYSSE